MTNVANRTVQTAVAAVASVVVSLVLTGGVVVGMTWDAAPAQQAAAAPMTVVAAR